MRNLVHGTETGYVYGCRCDDCKRARRRATQRRGANIRTGHRGDQKRAADEALKHPCSSEGCEVRVSRQATLCREHYLEEQQAKRRELQRMWLEGARLREIADALGTNVNVIGVTMAKMRQAGWDLPLRQRERANAS